MRLISAKKYDLPSLRESARRIETSNRKGCTLALRAQTGKPAKVSNIFTPKVRKKVLFPDILEPVSNIKACSLRVISLVMRCSEGIRGCPTASKAISYLLLRVGYTKLG